MNAQHTVAVERDLMRLYDLQIRIRKGCGAEEAPFHIETHERDSDGQSFYDRPHLDYKTAQKGPISVTRLTGEVVWIDASTRNEPDDAILEPEDEQRIAEVTLAGRSDLRSELEAVFSGPAWPQASAIIESFKPYAMKVFDVNALAYHKSVWVQGKNSNEVLKRDGT